MNILIVAALVLCALAAFPIGAKAQSEPKELVVVMSRNYTYEDPRWLSPVELKRGEAIVVQDQEGASYDFWPYPAADVAIPKRVTRLPGAVKGERYLVLTVSNARLLQSPSAQSPYYCYNVESSASVYHNQFVSDGNRPKTDEWGLEAEWQPVTYPKGTRLPYKGKQGGFFKTKIGTLEFFISARHCQLR